MLKKNQTSAKPNVSDVDDDDDDDDDDYYYYYYYFLRLLAQSRRLKIKQLWLDMALTQI